MTKILVLLAIILVLAIISGMLRIAEMKRRVFGGDEKKGEKN